MRKFLTLVPIFTSCALCASYPQRFFRKIPGGVCAFETKIVNKNMRILSTKPGYLDSSKLIKKMEIFSSKLSPELATPKKKIHHDLEIKVLIVLYY